MSATATTTTWGIDPYHSEIQFKVRHMMISTVTGQFGAFEGSLVSEKEDLEGSKIQFSADINSITTGNEQRDGHLKSDDFFNVESFPKLTFESVSFTKVGEGKFKLVGNLTIRDNTKSVDLEVDYFGQMVDAYGNTKAGFEINGAVSRKEFGLKWSAVTEAGGIVVSDEVKLHLNIQLARG